MESVNGYAKQVIFFLSLGGTLKGHVDTCPRLQAAGHHHEGIWELLFNFSETLLAEPVPVPSWSRQRPGCYQSRQYPRAHRDLS